MAKYPSVSVGGGLVAPTSRPRKPNKGSRKGHKRKGGGKGRGKGRGKGVPRFKGLFEPLEVLRGPALRRAAQQAVNFQINPALRQTNRALAELSKREGYELGKVHALGQQVGRNIGSYYQRLAEEEAGRLEGMKAAGATLTASVGAAVDRSGKAIGEAGTAAEGGIGAYQGQSIAARDRLAALMAETQGQVAQQGAALQSQAASQASGQEALLRNILAATQMRGGEVAADAQRAIANQAADLRTRFGEEASKLRGTKLELLLQRPELARQALKELRESERTQYLSARALGLKEKEAKAGTNYARISTRENIRLAKLKANLRLRELREAGATNAQLAREKARLTRGILKLQQRGYGKGGKGGGKSEGWQPFSKVYSYLRSQTHAKYLLWGGEGKSAKQWRRAAYDKLRSYGATDKDARRAIKRYINKFRKSKRFQPSNIKGR